MKKIILLIAVFLFSCVCVSAVTLNQNGYSDNSFYSGETTRLNAQPIDSWVIYSNIAQNKGYVQPLVYNLDQDSKKYLILPSGGNILVYSNKSLLNNPYRSYYIGSYIGNIKFFTYNSSVYMVLTKSDNYNSEYYDPDMQNMYINVYLWNNSNFSLIGVHQSDIPNSDWWNGLKYNCDENNGRCIAKYSTYAYAFAFRLNSATSYDAVWSLNAGCNGAYSYSWMPAINNFNYIYISPSYPNKGYIYTSVAKADLTGNTYDICLIENYYNSSNSQNYKIYNGIIATGLTWTNTEHQFNSSYNLTKRFTQPLIGQFSASCVDGIVFAYASNVNELTIKDVCLDSGTLRTIKTRVMTLNNTIVQLSNMFKAKVFTRDNYANYCVIATMVNNQNAIICATDYYQGFSLSVNDQKILYYSAAVVKDFYSVQEIAQSVEAYTNPENNIERTEIITADGVYSVGNVDIWGVGSANQIIGNMDPAIVSLSNGFDGGSYSDLLRFTKTNIFYIDDNINNNNAVISSVTTNPCYNAINLNNSVSVSVQITDSENNLVTARAEFYSGTEYVQNTTFSDFASTGTYFSWTFIANMTVNNGILKILAKDSLHNDTTVYSMPFNVVLSGGYNYGQSQCSSTPVVNTSTTTQAGNYTSGNIPTNRVNSITNIMNNTSMKMGLPVEIMLLFVALGVNLVILLYTLSNGFLKDHLITVMILCGVLDFGGLILATLTGLIGYSLILTLVVILLIVGGLYISSMFRKPAGG